MDSLPSLLLRGAGDAAAISAPEGKPLSYQGLREMAARTVERLNGLGIGRGDRVAVVLNNGPEMAAAFVSIAAAAAIAPLTAGYGTVEFAFYLGDLTPKALVIEAGLDSPSRAVAARLGVPIVEVHADRASGAGSFRLEPLAPMQGRASSAGPAGTDDVALLLHTSGTTSRPKLVPLLQKNITASARHIASTLALAPGDTCLSIM